MEHKSEGNRYFQIGDFEQAKQAYTKGIRSADAADSVLLAQLYCNRATVNIHLQQFAEAKKDAKHASELAPHWAKPYLRQAEAYDGMHRHHKATIRLEESLRIATAACDVGLVKEIKQKLPGFRLRGDEERRRENADLSSGAKKVGYRELSHATQIHVIKETKIPGTNLGGILDTNEAIIDENTIKHLALGAQAARENRFLDASREFKAAATSESTEGMYIYGIVLVLGQGVQKDVSQGLCWLGKAADAKPPTKWTARALGSLGTLYKVGNAVAKNETRARQYWERGAKLGDIAGCNNLAVSLMDGIGGKADLPRARDLLRQCAESFSNQAMSNLARLHASVNEFETAIRWADTAFKFGLESAADDALEYQKVGKGMNQILNAVGDSFDLFVDKISEHGSILEEQEPRAPPSLEELRAIDTPYCKRLLLAKEEITAASDLVAPDVQMMIAAVQLSAHAYRIEDGHLVFSTEDALGAFLAANFLLEAGVQLNADLALCLGVTDPADTSDADEDLSVRLFDKALSMLPQPNNDSDPTTMGLFFEAASAFFVSDRHLLAQDLLTRFLKHALTDGHRKAAAAHYMLGVMELKTVNASGSASKRKAKLKRSITEARAHLREGIALENRLPEFLREDDVSLHRKFLEGLLDIMPMVTPPLVTVPTGPSDPKRGGELLSGPRRHAKLHCDASMLTTAWRKAAAKSAKANAGMNAHSNSSVPPRSSTDGPSASAAEPATIDELFSALEDRVYKDRLVHCLVVSIPMVSGAQSYRLIVEDSQREPARVVVCNATPSLVKQLVPGQELTLLSPDVHIDSNGQIVLRVDDPLAAIQLKTKHAICWVCSVVERSDRPLSRCVKCHKAFYCSRKCQTQDWTADGHRFMCAALQNDGRGGARQPVAPGAGGPRQRAAAARETFDQQQKGVAWRKGREFTSAYPDLERSLYANQRGLVRDGKVAAWDVTLCNRVLKHTRGLEEDEVSAVDAVVAARNHCAHAAGGRVTDADFKHYYARDSQAYEELGGDVAVLQQIRDRVADINDGDVPVLLTSNEKATKTATDLKSEGNQLFQAGAFPEAKRAYTKGIQLAGAIDSFLLAQLYNNRATANLHQEDLQGANQDAKRASVLAPQWAKPHLRLAEVYNKMTKYSKSMDRLEAALSLAQAAQDTAVEKEIRKKMPDYIRLKNQEAQCGDLNSGDANPFAFVDKLAKVDLGSNADLATKRHLMIGHRALADGRLSNAVREFMAAAIGGDAHGMYNYAVMLLSGQGVRRNIPEAVNWLEKAAASPVSPVRDENVGIAGAMSTLGCLYDGGIHYAKDKTCALEYWESSTALGSSQGRCNLATSLVNGTNGSTVNRPRACDLLRESS